MDSDYTHAQWAFIPSKVNAIVHITNLNPQTYIHLVQLQPWRETAVTDPDSLLVCVCVCVVVATDLSLGPGPAELHTAFTIALRFSSSRHLHPREKTSYFKM